MSFTRCRTRLIARADGHRWRKYTRLRDLSPMGPLSRFRRWQPRKSNPSLPQERLSSSCPDAAQARVASSRAPREARPRRHHAFDAPLGRQDLSRSAGVCYPTLTGEGLAPSGEAQLEERASPLRGSPRSSSRRTIVRFYRTVHSEGSVCSHDLACYNVFLQPTTTIETRR